MARLFAQVFSLVFFVATFGGLLLGDASHGGGGLAGGNLGSITLHLTWWRDVLDAVMLAALVYGGFVADRRSGRIVVTVVGVLLLALSIGGFSVGDDDVASKGFLGMHFPAAVNVFDLLAGALAVLCGLGTIEEPATE